MLPVLVLYRLFVRLGEPETADRRIRIPAGRPEVMTFSAVPRPFRSGRCSPCAFSTRADTVRIWVSTSMMIVKAARSFRCAFICGFLSTRVNRHPWIPGYFNAAIRQKLPLSAEKTVACGVISKIIPGQEEMVCNHAIGDPVLARDTEILNNCEVPSGNGDPL